MNLFDFMHNPPVAKHPNQGAIVEKRFYISTDYYDMLLLRKKSGDSI